MKPLVTAQYPAWMSVVWDLSIVRGFGVILVAIRRISVDFSDNPVDNPIV